MSPLQRIAMGLVIVFLTAPVGGTGDAETYDALPDPLGWLLVVLGVHALARVDDTFTTSRWLAVVAGLVSVPLWLPQVRTQLDPSGQWFASLPQVVFCLLLAREIGLLAARQSPPDGYTVRRAGLLVWGFALVAVLPVLAIGGGVAALGSTAVVVSLVVNVTFVYVLFRVHRRVWLGGPGPLEVRAGPGAAGARPEARPVPPPGEREGRPPSG